MEHRWAYSERSNMRKRAVKRVNDMILSLDSDISASLGVNQTQEESVVASCSGAASSEFADSYGSEEEVDCEIESETSEDEDSSPSDLRSSLSDWAVEFGVSLVALSALLSILRVHHPFLPKDGRSLLKTRTQYVVENIAGGSFYYFGILNTLGKTFHEIASKVPDRHTFKLQLNFDGLPLFKNSSVQFWPVLGKLQEYATKGPVLIAVFCGESKPTSLSEYLSALVKELKTLSDGFIVGGKVFFVKVSSVMCDAPARAFIKGIKSHTGYAGCDKCVQSGVYMNHRMTFPETHAACRTDESFRVNADEDHHLHQSPLLETDIGMVSCFPHDYMHLVCLGVVRKCLDLWMGSTGPLRCRLSTRESDAVSERLMALRSFVPVEFARKPRRLSERLRWKATELRQSLLYTGPVVLRGVLADEVYSNFMLLSVAISILANPTFCFMLNDFANTLLVSFVEHFSQLYGPEFVVYNVHGLIHLSDDVKHHGHLDLISGFSFENYLQKLKKMVRKPHSPLTQIIRRVSEMESINPKNTTQTQDNKTQTNLEHRDGPVPQLFTGRVCQFRELVTSGGVIRTSEGDNCIKFNNAVVLVQNIVLYQDKLYVIYKEYSRKGTFFDYPIDSCELEVFVVSHLSSDLRYARLEEDVHVTKYFRMPLEVQVSFVDTQEVEVVAALWVKDGVCLWPPYKSEGVQRAIKMQEHPGDNWTPYKIKVLYTANHYNEARRKLPLAEQQTDLQSEAEDESLKPPKRKIKPNKRLLEDGYNTDEEALVPKKNFYLKPPE
ncbi:uncharacterized protein LOC143509924 isoform X2 [Brachyhypopomus gauderio]